jgi:hypothetical protein
LFGVSLSILLGILFEFLQIACVPFPILLEHGILVLGVIFAADLVVSFLVGFVSFPRFLFDFLCVSLVIVFRISKTYGTRFLNVVPVSPLLVGVETNAVGLGPFVATFGTSGIASSRAFKVKIFDREGIKAFSANLLHAVDCKLIYGENQEGDACR